METISTNNQTIWYDPELLAQGEFLIDGGFGELSRRQYFNRLLYLRKKSPSKRDKKITSQYLKVQRADIFNDEITRLMNGASNIHI